MLAERGLGFTSLRAIIGGAGVNLNAIHYHYGSGDALYAALVDRAMKPLNDERLARLDALETDAAARDVIEAGYAPLFERALRPQEPLDRELLLVVQQMRHAPSRPARKALMVASTRFIDAIEPAARRAIGSSRVREGLILVNSVAWDTALRPDVWERVDSARSRVGETRRVLGRFLTFATGGLMAEARA